MISRLDFRTMKIPRRGTVLTKPSCSRIDSASRTGVRLTPSACINSRSSSRRGWRSLYMSVLAMASLSKVYA